MLENRVKLLKDKVDQMSLSDPKFSFVTEIGELSIKDLEYKKVKEELKKVKQDVSDKDKSLSDSLAKEKKSEETT